MAMGETLLRKRNILANCTRAMGEVLLGKSDLNSNHGVKKSRYFCKFVNMIEKNLYIIAGCNGAGKTTASFTILPEIIDCREFVNADEIAKGLSPFQPEKVSFEAGRIMLNRITELLGNNESFAFETTLSTKSYKQKVKDAKLKGFTTTLLFFLLQNAGELRLYP